jgi:hypothetical protein
MTLYKMNNNAFRATKTVGVGVCNLGVRAGGAERKKRRDNFLGDLKAARG